MHKTRPRRTKEVVGLALRSWWNDGDVDQWKIGGFDEVEEARLDRLHENIIVTLCLGGGSTTEIQLLEDIFNTIASLYGINDDHWGFMAMFGDLGPSGLARDNQKGL